MLQKLVLMLAYVVMKAMVVETMVDLPVPMISMIVELIMVVVYQHHGHVIYTGVIVMIV